MVNAVMLDLEKKETYVERFENDENYEAVLRENIDIRHPTSIFENYKGAVREAKRLGKDSYCKGWSYNNSRNS